MGPGYAPFVPGKDGQLQKDMRLNLPQERFFGDRRALLAQLDRLKYELETTGRFDALNDIEKQAYRLLSGGGVADALDLSNENPQVVERYDTRRYEHPDGWSKVNRGKQGMYTSHARSLGKLLLLARRLCEAGCGFVTIHASYAGVWDMHADGNNLNMLDGMQAVGRSFDHAVATFVEDLEARGLDDQIMLVCSGEMGRTPRINNRGGRDHWSRLAPLLVYGGGIRGGQVIGQSTRDGGQPATENFTPSHLIATIMNTVFDVGQLRLVSGVPIDLLRLAQAKPIPGVV